MKREFAWLAPFFVLLPSLSYSETTTLVPINLGDITFFVQGVVSVPPPEPPPDPPSQVADANLQNCIKQAKEQNGWINDSEVTELYCASRNIVDLTGIDAFVNLERLAINNNYIDDVTPLRGLSKLKWLHMASFYMTDSIFTDDIDALKNLPLLEEIYVNNDVSDPARIPVNYDNIYEGFLGINAFDDGFPALKAITFSSFDELAHPTGRPMACETLNAINMRWSSAIAAGTFSLNGLPSLPCTVTQPNESY